MCIRDSYNADGSVRLRSEGFKTSQNRDQELAKVIRLKDNESYYTLLEMGRYSIRILNDETGREIGRSTVMTKSDGAASTSSFDAGSTGVKSATKVTGNSSMSTSTGASSSTTTTTGSTSTGSTSYGSTAGSGSGSTGYKVVEDEDKEDDYLSCKEYKLSLIHI